MKKSSKIIVGIVIVLLIAIIGVCIWMLVDNQRKYEDRIKTLESQILNINKDDNVESNSNNASTTQKEIEKESVKENEKNNKVDTKEDYSKYFGTWSDDKGNEFTVRIIGNNFISFRLFIYRTALMEDATLPLKDNKATFYYHGFDDTNFNGINEDDEFYCRKATIELRENNIVVTVEDSDYAEAIEDMSLDKTWSFDGGVYIKPGELYIFKKSN